MAHYDPERERERARAINKERKKPRIYMIGQRAIYQDVIVTVCAPERAPQPSTLVTWVWIDNPEKGYKHMVSPDSLKPLPNGQL